MEASHKKMRLRIGGMTCVNCQNKIEKKLYRTEGIVSARVSYTDGTADIVYDEAKISRPEIIAVIEKLEYKVLPDQRQKGSDLVRIVGTLAIIVALYVMLQSLGIMNLLAPGQLADTKMGYGMLFLIGLVTSVHCVAMCGGINLSQCLPQTKEKENGDRGRLGIFAPALSYNLGRVISYTAVGFVLGAVGFLAGQGAEAGLSSLFQGILKIIAGIFMVIMGLNMLDLFPWLRRFTVRMPGFLARRIGKEKARSSRPLIVGILNGFMPCGPLQSMWIVALASGNPLAGALSMFLFSLGTVPLMLGLGSVVAALGKKFADKVMTVGAVLVVVLGLAMVSQGGALSGWLPSGLLLTLVIALCIAGVLLSIPVRKQQWSYALKLASVLLVMGSYSLWSFLGTTASGSPAVSEEGEIVDGVQVINSTLSTGRYPSITVRAGIPVKWVIDAPEGSINGCNYKMMIRNYNIEHTFQTGENVIEFTPTEVGTVPYSCWMGMIRGNIYVTDGSGAAPAADAGEPVSVPVPAGYEIPTDSIALASLSGGGNEGDIQEVSIELTDEGFSPAVVVVQKNVTVVWTIENKMTGAENGVGLLVPYYSTDLYLAQGTNQLRFYPAESFDVSTEDNRFYCYIKVVDDLSNVDEAAVKAEAAKYETLIYPAEIFDAAGGSCCG